MIYFETVRHLKRKLDQELGRYDRLEVASFTH